MMEDNELMDELDPDSNFFDDYYATLNVDRQSNYYDMDRVGQVLNENNNNLTILNYNIRSFYRNFDEFQCVFGDIQSCFHVIVFTETWFSTTSPPYLIEGYTGHHAIRDGRGGGVSVYCKKNLISYKIDRLCSVNNVIEICVVEVTNAGDDLVIIVSVYKPVNSNITEFCEALGSVLDDGELRGREVIVTGDFNINILNGDILVNGVSDFINVMHSFNFLPRITKPTRFPTGDQLGQPSLLDHIWYNKMSLCVSGIVMCDISDHLPCFLQINRKISTESKLIKIMFRDRSEINMICFCNNIREWNFHYDDRMGVSHVTRQFLNELNSIYCRSFPLKQKIVSRRRFNTPWLSNALMTKIKNKTKYFKLNKLGLISNEFYKKYRNNVNKTVRVAKKTYFDQYFNDNRNNMRKTWSVIKDLAGMGKTREGIKSLLVDGREVSGEHELAEAFNVYFTQIASRLDESIPPPVGDPIDNLSINCMRSFFVFPVTLNELHCVVANLKNKRYGLNEIPVCVFKRIFPIVANGVLNIINDSFIQGVFPDSLKIAHVTPIYKAGNKNDPCNYRPISILPFFSKIIEKCMANRLMKYLDKFNMLNVCQYGFRKNRNTTSAILNFVEHIYECLNNKQHALGVFIDLRKAFDTVSHSILLKKMHKYGIRGVAHKWFNSFLCNRMQHVRIGNSISQSRTINISVPQGSTLSSLLFLIYINDMPGVSNAIKFTLFADDTTLATSNVNYSDLISITNIELNKVYDWTLNNRLSLNTDKTYAILFTNRVGSIQTPYVVTLGGSNVPFVDGIKFLGLQLDNKLNMNEHISYIAGKLSKTIGILYKLHNIIPTQSMISLYYALFYPYFTYCISIWGGTADTHLNCLIVIQKRAVRLIACSDYLAHTTPLFYQLKILKLKDIYKLNLAVHMYKLHCNNSITLPVHHYETRQRQRAVPSFERLSQCQKSINFMGPKIWNEIPHNIQNSPSMRTFKKSYFNYLLSNYVSS